MVTPKARAKLELLFNMLAYVSKLELFFNMMASVSALLSLQWDLSITPNYDQNFKNMVRPKAPAKLELLLTMLALVAVLLNIEVGLK